MNNKEDIEMQRPDGVIVEIKQIDVDKFLQKGWTIKGLELSTVERSGIKIRHKRVGTEGIITHAVKDGFNVYVSKEKKSFILPFKNINEWIKEETETEEIAMITIKEQDLELLETEKNVWKYESLNKELAKIRIKSIENLQDIVNKKKHTNDFTTDELKEMLKQIKLMENMQRIIHYSIKDKIKDAIQLK